MLARFSDVYVRLFLLLTLVATVGCGDDLARARGNADGGLAGPALHFTPDDQILPASVEIGLPHGGGEARFELFAVEEDALVGIEACEVDDTTIGQSLTLLGTFVATSDDDPYAESTGESAPAPR
jgi:hypothetical protein